MKLRHRYLIAGIAWAAFFGPMAAHAVFGVAAGFSWLYLFGDSPWPDAAKWIILLIALAGGLAVSALCVFAMAFHGRRREALPAADTRFERRRVLLLGAAPVLALALVGAALWKDAADRRQARLLSNRRQADLAALIAARHEITGVAVARDRNGVFHATVDLAGGRRGKYRMRWQVADANFGKVLAGGTRPLELEPGHATTSVAFTLRDLAASYRDRVLSGGGVLVDEPFRLTVTLDPVLSPEERAGLPPEARTPGRPARTKLRATASARFPVRFVVAADGSIRP